MNMSRISFGIMRLGFLLTIMKIQEILFVGCIYISYPPPLPGTYVLLVFYGLRNKRMTILGVYFSYMSFRHRCRRIAYRTPYRIPPLYTLKNLLQFMK